MMLFPQKNIFICGRGSTAIYLILQCMKNRDDRRKIIVPANICYAAVYPLIYAGYSPVFCDVSPIDGNVSMDCIKAKMDSDIGGLLIPHMYGNPVQEIAEISSFCRRNGIFLLEDCASSMGARLSDGRPVGCFGDYSIYSTGYAKTVDVGIGGMITSNNDLAGLDTLEKELPYHSKDLQEKERIFSSRYRQFRNSNQKLRGSKWETFFLRTSHRCLFLYRLNKNTKERIAAEIRNRLFFEINRRRENHVLYCRYLQGTASLKIYPYHAGAVPWRFSVYVPPGKRREIIELLLDWKQPVSDWYPPVVQLFDSAEDYPGAESSGSSILNFPLTLSQDEISQLCYRLLKITRKVI